MAPRCREWVVALLLLLGAVAGCGGDGAGTAVTATVTPALEDPPAHVARPLVVEDHGFVQEGVNVDYGFIVWNPNAGVAVVRSGYRVVVYDAAGTELGSANGLIAHVAPGATWGAGGRLRVGDAPIAELKVLVEPGEGAADFPRPTFRVEDPARFDLGGDRGTRITGVVRSPYRLGVTDLRIDVVFVDEEGVVVSGTVVYAGYVPGEAPIGIGEASIGIAEGAVGVAATTRALGVAEARFYPTLGGLARFHDPDEWPDGAMVPVLTAQGFGREGDRLTWGAEVHNPSDVVAIERWVLSLTALDARGNVLAAFSGRERWLLTDQRLGVLQHLTMPPGERVDRVVAELVPLSFVAAGEVERVPRFTAEEVRFEADPLFPKVRGTIVNPGDRAVSHVKVVALLYAAEGGVTGGGTTYLDTLPAGGRADVALYVSGETERVGWAELSATVTPRSGSRSE